MAARYATVSHFLFPTQVVVSDNADYAGMREEFVAMCYRARENDPAGAQRSGVNRWQSRDTVFSSGENGRYLSWLQGQIDACLRTEFQWADTAGFVVCNAWINISGKHAYDVCHVHPQSLLSGVFYVKVPANSGALTFRNDKEFQSFREWQLKSWALTDRYNMSPAFECAPAEGRMILFPAWLPHEVGINLSDEDRISISFNVLDFPRKVTLQGSAE